MIYELNDPDLRLSEIEYDFTYKGLTCYITLSCFGWRCAYIKLPKGHKYNGRHENTLSFIECHGGITFAGSSHVCIYCDNDEWLIGWDYNHQYDAYDFEAVERLFGPGIIADLQTKYYFSNANMMYHGPDSKKFSIEDVVQEIKQVIDKYKLDEL